MAFSATATQNVEDDVVTSLASASEQQREEVVSLRCRVTDPEAREEKELSHSEAEEGEEGSFEQGLATGEEAVESSPAETWVERGRKLKMEDLLGVADSDHRAQPKQRQPMDFEVLRQGTAAADQLPHPAASRPGIALSDIRLR
ncbi:unnamed protein product [Polarella glacialis]|uniref:Uncharacterized protein n=1 Tax=Polarella glacialis TaxID=89957 RepID=A0A813HIJ0_POLGL|nr:unnamed protein product [Polarella glacialis]